MLPICPPLGTFFYFVGVCLDLHTDQIGFWNILMNRAMPCPNMSSVGAMCHMESFQAKFNFHAIIFASWSFVFESQSFVLGSWILVSVSPWSFIALDNLYLLNVLLITLSKCAFLVHLDRCRSLVLDFPANTTQSSCRTTDYSKNMSNECTHKKTAQFVYLLFLSVDGHEPPNMP